MCNPDLPFPFLRYVIQYASYYGLSEQGIWYLVRALLIAQIDQSMEQHLASIIKPLHEIRERYQCELDRLGRLLAEGNTETLEAEGV
jgi:hypothetical protein